MAQEPFRWGGSGHDCVDQCGTGLNRIRPAFVILASGLMALRQDISGPEAGRQRLGRQAGRAEVSGLHAQDREPGYRSQDDRDLPRRAGQRAVALAVRHAAQRLGSADQVVPVEQAIEFFTDYIRSSPGDAHGYIMRAIIWPRRGRSSTSPSGTTTKRFGSIRSASAYINRGMAWRHKRNTTRPSPTTTRRFDSIQISSPLLQPWLNLERQEGIRQGDRRFTTRPFGLIRNTLTLTTTAHGSGPHAPMRNTATARRPSSLRRRRASFRSGRNQTTSTHSRQPMLRQTISTRPSSGSPRRSNFRTMRRQRKTFVPGSSSTRKRSLTARRIPDDLEKRRPVQLARRAGHEVIDCCGRAFETLAADPL